MECPPEWNLEGDGLMLARGWVGPAIGLVVSLLLYVLLIPLMPAGTGPILSVVLIIAIVVCVVLLIVALARGRF